MIATVDLPGEMMAEAGPILVQAAREVDVTRLRHVVTHLRDAADRDGVADEADDRYERRGLYASSTWQGMAMVDGSLDPEGGATVLTALDAASQPDPVATPATHPGAAASGRISVWPCGR